jgi:hypothetical protein
MKVFMRAHSTKRTKKQTCKREHTRARTHGRGTSRTSTPLSPPRPSSPPPLPHTPHTQVQLNGIDVAQVVKENGVRQADWHLAPDSVGSAVDRASASAAAASSLSAAPPAQQPPSQGVCMCVHARSCVRACVRRAYVSYPARALSRNPGVVGEWRVTDVSAAWSIAVHHGLCVCLSRMHTCTYLSRPRARSGTVGLSPPSDDDLRAVSEVRACMCVFAWMNEWVGVECVDR